MVEVYISVGSNIDPEKNIEKAILLLSSHVKILDVSTVYLTKPIGDQDQPRYYNCVLKVWTDTPPRDLKFKILKGIEERMGRDRSRGKFAPRTIDLDILDYGGIHVRSRGLTLPDPDIPDRPFIGASLRELKFSPPNGELKASTENLRFANNGWMTPLIEYTESLRRLVKRLGDESKAA